MKKLISKLMLVVFAVTFLPITVLAENSPVLAELTPTAVLGETMSLNGENLLPDEGEYALVIYASGAEAVADNFTYPTVLERTESRIDFLLNWAEGQPLYNGNEYVVNLWYNGALMADGISFVIQDVESGASGFELEGSGETTVTSIELATPTPTPESLGLYDSSGDTVTNGFGVETFATPTPTPTSTPTPTPTPIVVTVTQSPQPESTVVEADSSIVIDPNSGPVIDLSTPTPTPTLTPEAVITTAAPGVVIDPNSGPVIDLSTPTPTPGLTTLPSASPVVLSTPATVLSPAPTVMPVASPSAIAKPISTLPTLDLPTIEESVLPESTPPAVSTPKPTLVEAAKEEGKTEAVNLVSSIYKDVDTETVQAAVAVFTDYKESAETVDTLLASGQTDGAKDISGLTEKLVEEPLIGEAANIAKQALSQAKTDLLSGKDYSLVANDLKKQLDSAITKNNDEKYQRGQVSYKDVAENVDNWYFKAVSEMTDKGIVSGYADADGYPIGEYKPANTVNVAESLKMVLESSGLGKKEGGASKNPDAEKTWAKEYFAKAEDLGLSKIADGNVAPGKSATRGEISCWIAKSFDLPQVDLNYQFKDVKAGRADLSCLGATYGAGIIKGDGNGEYMRPDDSINRAEMATVIQRAMDYKAKRGDLRVCADESEWKNLRMYDLKGEVVHNSGVPVVTNGKYTVKLEVSVQSEDTNEAIENVNVNVYTHDITKILGNNYKETIKSYAVPATFSNVTIPAGKIVTLKTDVEVPVDYYIADSAGKHLILSAAVDLPDNNILETVDVADNVATAFVWFAKNDQNEVRKITKREIQTNQMRPDAVYATVKTDKVNPYIDRKVVFSRYFQGMNIANLDGLVKGCLNLRVKPGSIKVYEHKVYDGTGVELEIHGKIEKTGGVNLPSYNIVEGFYKDEGEFKPLKNLKVWKSSETSEYKGDGTNLDYAFSGRFTIAPKTDKIDLVFWVDPDKSISEYDEGDNEFVQPYTFNKKDYVDLELSDFKVTEAGPYSDARSSLYGNVDVKVKNAGTSEIDDKFSIRIDYMDDKGNFVPWIYRSYNDGSLVSGGGIKVGETKGLYWFGMDRQKLFDLKKTYVMRATVVKDFDYEFNKGNNTKYFTYTPAGYYNVIASGITVDGKKVGDMLDYDSLWSVWVGGQKENVNWYKLPLKFKFELENKKDMRYTGKVQIGAYHLSCDRVCKNLKDNEPDVFVNPAEASMYFTNNDTWYYLYTFNYKNFLLEKVYTPIVMDDKKIEYVVYAYIQGYKEYSPTKVEYTPFFEDMNGSDNAMAAKITIENGKLTGVVPYDINEVAKKVPQVKEALYQVVQ